MNQPQPVIAFIGAGNMAASIISGLIAYGYNPDLIWASNPDEAKLTQLQQQYQINVTRNNQEAAAPADVIIIAVKPQIFAQVAQELADTIQARKQMVISIAAGIKLEHMQQWFGAQVPIVRCMPNTPALIGYGAAGMYASSQVSAEQKQLAQMIMEAVGIALWLEQESLIDAVTALSGSGPAYFFLMLEALVNAAQCLGLTADIAQRLAVQTALGAAKMASQETAELAQLRQQVTSPGGTTEQAIKALEAGGFRQLIAAALTAAQQRSIELAQLSEK